MIRQSLFFVDVGKVEVREEQLPAPLGGELLVETIASAISPGTEMLAYRGQIPADMALDSSIEGLKTSSHYPFKYGYSCVGRVTGVGPDVDKSWLGQMVFSFQPHQSRFIAPVDSVISLPEGMDPLCAVFLPNMETAVNLVMDARPIIGETAAVFGLGVVGLMTTALLSQFPLSGLAGVDRYDARRKAALEVGADLCLDPGQAGVEGAVAHWLVDRNSPDGFDLLLELSGSPAALDHAVALAGFTSRVIVGSWYGSKRVSLDLGGRFHRSRMQLISSQVSTIAPDLSGRWSKHRRFAQAWKMIAHVQPDRWITHRFPIANAGEAFRLIDTHPEDTIQVILTYD